MLDRSRKGVEVPGQRRRVRDRPEITVEYQIPVVGDDRAVLAIRGPEGRLAPASGHGVGDRPPRCREHRHRHRRVEHVALLALVHDHEEPLGRGVDDLLSDAARRAEANDRKTVQPRDL